MRTHFLLPLIAAGLAGCSGLDITPISPTEDTAAHAGGSALKGYIVYAPIVVVEISQQTVCSKKDDKGNCTGDTRITCTAGTPFQLPDPSKPFLINPHSGLGKAGVDVTISNGWQLGNIKDQSDNTSLLGTMEKALSIAKSTTREPETGKCKAPGLYQVQWKDNRLQLVPLFDY